MIMNMLLKERVRNLNGEAGVSFQFSNAFLPSIALEFAMQKSAHVKRYAFEMFTIWQYYSKDDITNAEFI